MSDFRINLDKANTIIAATFAKGREAGMKPLSCVVVDAGGHVIAFQRQDGTSFLRLDIARGKAAGALALGVNSRRIGEMAAERPSFIASLGHLAANGLIPREPGVRIRDPAVVHVNAARLDEPPRFALGRSELHAREEIDHAEAGAGKFVR